MAGFGQGAVSFKFLKLEPVGIDRNILPEELTNNSCDPAEQSENISKVTFQGLFFLIFTLFFFLFSQ